MTSYGGHYRLAPTPLDKEIKKAGLRRRRKAFSHLEFPAVRRVFAGLVSNEIVSIQPMSRPASGVFFLDYTYGKAKKPSGKSENQWKREQRVERKKMKTYNQGESECLTLL